MKQVMDNDETLTIDPAEEQENAGCQVRRKIEEYLERRRTRDELGELDELVDRTRDELGELDELVDI